MPGVIIVLKYPKPLFLFNLEGENVSKHSVSRNCWQKIYIMTKIKLYLKRFSQNSHPIGTKLMAKLFRRGISVLISLFVFCAVCLYFPTLIGSEENEDDVTEQSFSSSALRLIGVYGG